MNNFIKSPLNYMGGKYKLLTQLINLFPNEIEVFYDLFAGGFNVGINVDSKKTIANDNQKYLIELYEYMKETEDFLESIHDLIEKYHLSQKNQEGYLKLREDYNNQPNPLMLYALTCYSFNHQIRFNNSHKFNSPFGKDRSHFNENMRKNLINFLSALKKKDIAFLNSDFDLDTNIYKSNDFVYCDPPYLISTGSYNDGKRGFEGWTRNHEIKLLNYLDEIHNKGIKFALSNVFENKGLKNDLLIEWSKKYKTHYLNMNYNNSNYQRKNSGSTIEVLVTNYNEEGRLI